MELNKEFLYNIDLRFKDLGGIVGVIDNNTLILPDNWEPTHNTLAKCDIVVSKDQMPFNGQLLTLAFARLSPNVHLQSSKPIDWKKKLKAVSLQTNPLPTVQKYEELQPGHIIVFPTLFRSNGKMKVIKDVYREVTKEPHIWMVRVRDNHELQTTHCILAFKKSGKIGFFPMPKDKTFNDISYFRVLSNKEKVIRLRPKFLPTLETIKFFQVPKEFEFKKLDIKVTVA